MKRIIENVKKGLPKHWKVYAFLILAVFSAFAFLPPTTTGYWQCSLFDCLCDNYSFVCFEGDKIVRYNSQHEPLRAVEGEFERIGPRKIVWFYGDEQVVINIGWITLSMDICGETFTGSRIFNYLKTSKIIDDAIKNQSDSNKKRP
jgi:hypothetical protein